MPGTEESRKKKRKNKSKLYDLYAFGTTEGQQQEGGVYLESLKSKLHIIGLLQIHIMHEQLTGSHLHEHCQQLQAKKGGRGIESM